MEILKFRLGVHGTSDKLMDWKGAQKLFDEIGAEDKTLVLYDDEVDGTVHCSHDCWVHQGPMIFDQIEEHLERASSTDTKAGSTPSCSRLFAPYCQPWIRTGS